MYNSAPRHTEGEPAFESTSCTLWQGILAYLLFLDLSLFYFLVFDMGFHVCS